MPEQKTAIAYGKVGLVTPVTSRGTLLLGLSSLFQDPIEPSGESNLIYYGVGQIRVIGSAVATKIATTGRKQRIFLIT